MAKKHIEKSSLQLLEESDFEQQVVCKILRAGGLIGNIRTYMEERKRQTSFLPLLDSQWFHVKFPEFPLRIEAVLFEDKLPDLIEMFKNFTQTTLFRAFQQFLEMHACNHPTKPLGMVFNIDGITFVLHNYEAAAALPGRRFVRMLGDPPVTYAFEEFRTLLRCIGSEWASKPRDDAKEVQ